MTSTGLTVDTWATLDEHCPMTYDIDITVARLQLGDPAAPLTITVDRAGLDKLETLVREAKAALD
ncbi:hypothetical protein ACFQV2_10825 [Actinokineospora soli]|uniref:Uncharacterized protein n=1 Tax=Actinokineospora soli TaxID=1048753 RepID=A0ABW2TKN4_9PSEU